MRRTDYGKPTAVYRAFDAVRALLYVGMTHHPRTRFAQHREKFPWWADVADLTVDYYEDRWAAEAVEAAAILAERPRYNEAAYYVRRCWITSCRDFPQPLPVAAVPAPAHVARALGTRPGVLAVRHRSCREQRGQVLALSTAWAVPQAWKWNNCKPAGDPGTRQATADELSVLATGHGNSVACREMLFPYSARPWFVEDVSVDGWDLSAAAVTARPA